MLCLPFLRSSEILITDAMMIFAIRPLAAGLMAIFLPEVSIGFDPLNNYGRTSVNKELPTNERHTR
jgi:hypothetical protein